VRFPKDVEETRCSRRGVRERVEVKKESVEGTVGEREARAGLEEEFVEEKRRQRGRGGDEGGDEAVERGIGGALVLEEDGAEAEKEGRVGWRARSGCGSGDNSGETAREDERGGAEHGCMGDGREEDNKSG
jgi:hypothetical protein